MMRLLFLQVFHTNASYQRWDEALKNWGLTINRTRDLAWMATCWCDPKHATKNLSASMSAPVLSIPDSNEMTESEKAKREEDLKDLLSLPLDLCDPLKSAWNHVGVFPAQGTI